MLRRMAGEKGGADIPACRMVRVACPPRRRQECPRHLWAYTALVTVTYVPGPNQFNEDPLVLYPRTSDGAIVEGENNGIFGN